jgi:hypothetical protein
MLGCLVAGEWLEDSNAAKATASMTGYFGALSPL